MNMNMDLIDVLASLHLDETRVLCTRLPAHHILGRVSGDRKNHLPITLLMVFVRLVLNILLLCTPNCLWKQPDLPVSIKMNTNEK